MGKNWDEVHDYAAIKFESVNNDYIYKKLNYYSQERNQTDLRLEVLNCTI